METRLDKQIKIYNDFAFSLPLHFALGFTAGAIVGFGVRRPFRMGMLVAGMTEGLAWRQADTEMRMLESK